MAWVRSAVLMATWQLHCSPLAVLYHRSAPLDGWRHRAWGRPQLLDWSCDTSPFRVHTNSQIIKNYADTKYATDRASSLKLRHCGTLQICNLNKFVSLLVEKFYESIFDKGSFCLFQFTLAVRVSVNGKNGSNKMAPEINPIIIDLSVYTYM